MKSFLLLLSVLFFPGCVIPLSLPPREVVQSAENASGVLIEPENTEFLRIKILSKVGSPIENLRLKISIESEKFPELKLSREIAYLSKDSREERKIVFPVEDGLVIPLTVYPQSMFPLLPENCLGVAVPEAFGQRIRVRVDILETSSDDLMISYLYAKIRLSWLATFLGETMRLGHGAKMERCARMELSDCLALWKGLPPASEKDCAALCYNAENCVFRERRCSFSEILKMREVRVLYFFSAFDASSFPLPPLFEREKVSAFDSLLPKQIEKWSIVPDKEYRFWHGL